MTEKQLNNGIDLKERISHYNSMLKTLDEKVYKLEPPTRHSGFFINGNNSTITLNEEDVICIKEAFVKKRQQLIDMFSEL